MKRLCFLLLALLLISVSMNIWQHGRTDVRQTTVEETVVHTRIDTIRLLGPAIVSRKPVRKEKHRMKVVSDSTATDTAALELPYAAADSADVEIPITSREYKGAGYRAWVSGYNPMLDSIEVYSTTTTVIPPKPRRKRWGIGVQAGYGLGRNGMQPYVGVGVSYNLLSF
ncbi:MAG: hypothetical protein SPF56_08590 [Bacteroidaceae bacterium]|nr:hypothetical protein [Bacteroidaceae bacterium]